MADTNDFNDENNDDKPKMSGRRRALPKALPAPRQTAKVKELADETAASHANADIEEHILLRIRKCLERANHPTTPEMEAKAALHMSSRLMARYNVTQADVMAQATDSNEQTQFAGQSTVSITSTKGPFTKVICQTWVGDVARAMTIFFDCKSYSTALPWSVEWAFYGIAANTVAAAAAFEMVHNLILEWARKKKGAVNSYCLGVAAGLKEMANEAKRQEEREAKMNEQDAVHEELKQEQERRRNELDRLNPAVDVTRPLTSCAVHVPDDNIIRQEDFASRNSSSDNDSSDEADEAMGHVVFKHQAEEEVEAETTFKVEKDLPMDPKADFEAELKRILKREDFLTPFGNAQSRSFSEAEVEKGLPGLPDVKPKLEDEDEQGLSTASSLWASASQLTLFRTTATTIADQYLKSTGTKLSSTRAPVSSIRDYAAYEQGKRDSCQIDVKRRRIC